QDMEHQSDADQGAADQQALGFAASQAPGERRQRQRYDGAKGDESRVRVTERADVELGLPAVHEHEGVAADGLERSENPIECSEVTSCEAGPDDPRAQDEVRGEGEREWEQRQG